MLKLNVKRDDLWQCPKAHIADPVQDEWYDNQVVGAGIGLGVVLDFLTHPFPA